jgi:diguanylate cyclase (GGDEF)-like protein
MPYQFFQRRQILLKASLWLLLCCLVSPAIALQAVTLQLKWTHAFQFAGYYAAIEQGYYRDAGLDVTLLEAKPGIDPVLHVLDGKAQYGVGNSNLLLVRKQGQPVVVLANIFQHSPQILIARQSSVTQSIHDLLGKNIMLEAQSDELLGYLKREGLPGERIHVLKHSFNPQDLIDGKVDAISAYVTNEPYFLDKARFPYQIYTPRASGIDFYGDNLFTTEQELKQHPDRARAFREASLRGWRYAMAHPEEIADLIRSKYSDKNPRDLFLYEAERMHGLLRTDLVEIGYMSPGRWRHIADTYAEMGQLPHDFSLSGFLYEANSKPDRTAIYLTLALLAVVSAISLYILRINRQLAKALAASKAAEERLSFMAQHDVLTGLANRALFSDLFKQALAESKRYEQIMALMYLDLDNFKQINDSFGHGMGDLLLKEAAHRMMAAIRESDTVARIGGDEFVLLLRSVDNEDSAVLVAEKIRLAMTQPFDLAGQQLHISASIGIALYPRHGSNEVELAQKADSSMYRAKKNGRNKVQMAEA